MLLTFLRWEEEKNNDGRKWTTLEHQGVVFADPYERLPSNILMKYNGEPVVLGQDAEEVAGFYARMLEHDYVTKEQFNKNFFKDFRKVRVVSLVFVKHLLNRYVIPLV